MSQWHESGAHSVTHLMLVLRPIGLLLSDVCRQAAFSEQGDFAVRRLANHSEVLPLEWRQVDLGAGEVRLDPGKTKNGEARTFPMTRELRELLDRQRTTTENLQCQLKVVCPRVFHRSGRPIKSFRVAFRTACAAAGCPGRVRGASCTTSAERRSAISSGPAFPSALPCR